MECSHGAPGVRLYYRPMGEAEEFTTPPEETRKTRHYDTQRTFPLSRRIQIPVISALVVAVLRVIGPTLRFDTPGFRHLDCVHTSGRRVIFAFWHRCMISMVWLMRRRNAVVMVSTNFDGQWARRAMESIGIGTAPGSSSRGGLRALAVMAQRMGQGCDGGFAIDGPHGPRYVAKAGPVLLARRTGCPIVCFHASPERNITLEKSWDLFQVPLPFSRVAVVFSPPMEVPRDANRELVERKHAEMQGTLERVRNAAEGWFHHSAAERERERKRWEQQAG
jgi:lysophospholipid acyltransferase (LPLAT)-like uncharacterized protein